MRSGRVMQGLLAGTALAGSVLHAQAGREPDPAPRVLISSSGPGPGSSFPAGEILREIDDPNNGDRWLLMVDSAHPGGPGRFRLVAGPHAPATEQGPTNSVANGPAPVIHTGDRVIVEEDRPFVQSRLESTAMGPALAGSPFNVRLAIGGRVERALAIAPGRAVAQTEARP